MTKREMFNAILSNEITDEVLAEVRKEVALLDARNAQRATANSAKKAVENAPLLEAIKSYFVANGGTHLTTEVAVGIGASTPKTSSLLRKMVDDGVLTAVDIKVKGKGVQKGYFLKK